jgi:hypothetical protein
VYLDDILLLGETKSQVDKHLNKVVSTLLEAGFKINVPKSTLSPVQSVQHLGFHLNFKKGCFEISPEKLKMIRRDLGKVVVADEFSCRKKWPQF